MLHLSHFTIYLWPPEFLGSGHLPIVCLAGMSTLKMCQLKEEWLQRCVCPWDRKEGDIMRWVGVWQGLLKMDWWAAKSQSCPCGPASQGEWHRGSKQMKEHFRLCQEACHQLVMEDWPVGIPSDYVHSFLIHPHPRNHGGRWLPVSDAPPPTTPHLPLLQLWLQWLIGALSIFIIPNTRKIMNIDK